MAELTAFTPSLKITMIKKRKKTFILKNIFCTCFKMPRFLVCFNLQRKYKKQNKKQLVTFYSTESYF